MASAACYFLLVFGVGVVLGSIRVLLVVPWIGETRAVLLESPFMLVAIVFAARWTMRRSGVRSLGALAAAGLCALLFQQLADVALGLFVRGRSVAEQFAYFATPPGLIYLVLLLAFLVMPVVAGRQPPLDGDS